MGRVGARWEPLAACLGRAILAAAAGLGQTLPSTDHTPDSHHAKSHPPPPPLVARVLPARQHLPARGAARGRLLRALQVRLHGLATRAHAHALLRALPTRTRVARLLAHLRGGGRGGGAWEEEGQPPSVEVAHALLLLWARAPLGPAPGALRGMDAHTPEADGDQLARYQASARLLRPMELRKRSAAATHGADARASEGCMGRRLHGQKHGQTAAWAPTHTPVRGQVHEQAQPHALTWLPHARRLLHSRAHWKARSQQRTRRASAPHAHRASVTTCK